MSLLTICTRLSVAMIAGTFALGLAAGDASSQADNNGSVQEEATKQETKQEDSTKSNADPKADVFTDGALTLYGQAATAFQEQRLEEAGVFFYAAQARVSLDTQLFPPTEAEAINLRKALTAINRPTGPDAELRLPARPRAFASSVGSSRSCRVPDRQRFTGLAIR